MKGRTSLAKRSHKILTALGWLVAIYASSCTWAEIPPIPREIGDPLPEVSSVTVKLDGIGDVNALHELTGDSGTLIHFWALWCIPCRAEMAWVESMRLHYGSRGIAFVGVAMDDRVSDAVRFMEQYGGESWPQLFDRDGEVARAFGVHGLPTVLLFDANRELAVFTASSGSVVEGYLEEELAKLAPE